MENYENNEVMVEEFEENNEGGLDKGLIIGAAVVATGAILAEHGAKKAFGLGKKFVGKVKEGIAARKNEEGELEEVEVVEEPTEE